MLSGAGQLYAFLGVVVASGFLLLILTRRSLVISDFQASSYEDEPDESDEPPDPVEPPGAAGRSAAAPPKPLPAPVALPGGTPGGAPAVSSAKPVPTATDRPA